MNTSLQQEVIMLKAEVQQLKSIILAHKDCPLMSNQHAKQGKRLKCINIRHNRLPYVTFHSHNNYCFVKFAFFFCELINEHS